MAAKRRADGGDEIKKVETEREQKGMNGKKTFRNRGREGEGYVMEVER